MDMDKLSKEEQLQISLLEVLEEIGDTLDKEQKDGIIMMYIESDLLKD